MEDQSSAAAMDDLMLKVAKTLQGSYVKQTTGTPRKWRDVPVDERQIWIRLARTALRLYGEAVPRAGAPAGPPPPTEAPTTPQAARPTAAPKLGLSQVLGGFGPPPGRKK